MPDDTDASPESNDESDRGGGVDPMPDCDPGKCSDTGKQTDPSISPDLGSGPGPGPTPV